MLRFWQSPGQVYCTKWLTIWSTRLSCTAALFISGWRVRMKKQFFFGRSRFRLRQ